MVKKALYILLPFVMLFSLCACNHGEEEMYIEPARLSEEEESLRRLLGPDAGHIDNIYDFALKDGVQTMEVNLYTLTEGKWEMLYGGSQGFSDTEGRIAFSYGKLAEGVRIALQAEKKSGVNSYTPTLDEDFSTMSTGAASLAERTEIRYDEEIPVVLQIITSKTAIRTLSTEYFFEPDILEEWGHEHVYAITVRFSQKTVAELEAERESQDVSALGA